MEITTTPLEGAVLIKPAIFTDSRGYFMESYNKKVLEEHGLPADFVQDNQSLSQKNALRGLHFQAPPHGQVKLVRVIRGAVLDVIVDIRKSSATYGKHFSAVLSEENQLQLLIPEGFAHGFLVLESDTLFSYKCSRYYNKDSEGGLFWADPDLNIDWNAGAPILSDKDQRLPGFSNFDSPFS